MATGSPVTKTTQEAAWTAVLATAATSIDKSADARWTQAPDRGR